MKRIAFLTSYGGQLFHPENNIDESPNCFGSELALVEVGRRLGKLAHVDVFISKDPGYRLNKWNINWYSSNDWDTYLETNSPSHIVVCRYMNCFIDYYIPESAKVLMWAHDPYFLPQYEGRMLNDAMMKNVEPLIDRFITVGHFQMTERLAPKYGLTAPFAAIRNGITLEPGFDPMKTVRTPLSFVWCSCPTRGLWTLLDKWKMILTIFPAATLTIYYTKSDESAKRFRPFEGDTSINYVGKVSQQVLFRKLQETDYWLYWCNNFESCCTTAMEMAYYGPIAIANPVGGLKENVLPEAGLIPMTNPYDSEAFYNRAIELIYRLETNPAEKREMRLKQFQWAVKQTWDDRMPQWKELFDL